MAKIRNKKTGEIREVSDKELSKYGLGGELDMAKNGKKIKMKLKKADTGKFIPTSESDKDIRFGVENEPSIPGNTGEFKATTGQMGLTDITNPYPFNAGLTNSLESYNKKQHYNFGKPILTADEQIQYKDFQDKNKPSLSVNNFSLTPITGNKYLNRGLKYLDQSIQHGMQIGSNPKDYKKPFNYYNGMSNGMFAEGGLTLSNANDSHYNFGTQNQFQNDYPTQINQQQTPIEMNSMGQNSIQSVGQQQSNSGLGSLNTNGNVQEPINSSQSGASGQNKFYNAMQGVAALTNLTQAGINFGKGALDMAGSSIQNRQAQDMQNKLYAQSIYSQNIDDRPNDTIYGRNTLAENGMQIREIGGKGKPSINYESKEHILLPNGFSQEVPGNTTHAKGGINGNFQPGTKIFSEALGIKANELRDLKEQLQFVPIAESGKEISNNTRGGENTEYNFLKHVKIPSKGNKEISYATMAKPFETKKNVDMLESKNADDIQKNTANIMIKFKQTQLEDLFNNFQETNKINGKHGDKVQQGAMEDYGFTPQDELEMLDYPQEENEEQYMNNMKEYGGLQKAQTGLLVETGKPVKDKNYKSKAVKTTIDDVVKKGYHYIESEGDKSYYGKDGQIAVVPKKGSEDFNKAFAEARKNKLKEFDFKGKKFKVELAKPSTATQGEYAYTQDPRLKPTLPQPIAQTQEIVPEIQYKDRIQYLKPNVEVDGLNLGIPFPNIYGREPLNYYKTNPNYVDPRHQSNVDEIYQHNRALKAFNSFNPDITGSGLSNRLQALGNMQNAIGTSNANLYNINKQIDSQAQQFNAQAKTQNDMYNQGTWFNQLENPIRQREGAIDTQQRMDNVASIENADKLASFYNNKNYIDQTFPYYDKMTPQQYLATMATPGWQQYLDNYDKTVTKTTKNGDVTTKEVTKKYGGKVNSKLKIKPKLKKK